MTTTQIPGASAARHVYDFAGIELGVCVGPI
jgi:hypothetical protein